MEEKTMLEMAIFWFVLITSIYGTFRMYFDIKNAIYKWQVNREVEQLLSINNRIYDQRLRENISEWLAEHDLMFYRNRGDVRVGHVNGLKYYNPMPPRLLAHILFVKFK